MKIPSYSAQGLRCRVMRHKRVEHGTIVQMLLFSWHSDHPSSKFWIVLPARSSVVMSLQRARRLLQELEGTCAICCTSDPFICIVASAILMLYVFIAACRMHKPRLSVSLYLLVKVIMPNNSHIADSQTCWLCRRAETLVA